MLDYIEINLKVPNEKHIITLENYGNTSSASVRLALTVVHSQKFKNTSQNLRLAGFVVGYGWPATTVSFRPIVISELVIMPK